MEVHRIAGFGYGTTLLKTSAQDYVVVLGLGHVFRHVSQTHYHTANALCDRFVHVNRRWLQVREHAGYIASARQ